MGFVFCFYGQGGISWNKGSVNSNLYLMGVKELLVAFE